MALEAGTVLGASTKDSKPLGTDSLGEPVFPRPCVLVATASLEILHVEEVYERINQSVLM